MFLFLAASAAWAEDPPSADEIDDFLGESQAVVVPPPAPSRLNAYNPRITAFGDALLSVAGDGSEIDPRSGPWLRSLELDMRADVDPYAKAVAILAFHQEPPISGDLQVDHDHDHDHEDEAVVAEEEDAHAAHASFEPVPEEVYVDLVSLPGGLGARIGQFKLPFGVTNKMHPHDYPWPQAPEGFVEVLGEEGVADIGAVGSWRVPNPLGLGVTLQGGAFRGTHWDPHDETALPSWLGRGELFYDFGLLDVGVGASSYGMATQHVDGADLLVRYAPNAWRSVVVVGEVFRQDDLLNWTSTLQLQPGRQVYLGLRADRSSEALRYGGWVAFYTSEFLRARAGATTDGDQWFADAQLTFVWGSHPVEPYWVNR